MKKLKREEMKNLNGGKPAGPPGVSCGCKALPLQFNPGCVFPDDDGPTSTSCPQNYIYVCCSN